MAEEIQYKASTGTATISTANSNLDGSTGSYTSVLTAGANGTKVKSLWIKARGSTTAEGMIRFFIDDGVNPKRLFAEVEVPIITQSGQDACFERYLPLDLDLKSGYSIYVTTEIADTFNIIAEGLDFSYLTQVRKNSTNYTANIGSGTITTANTNLDGTGSTTTILTAGATANGYKGCKIKSIVVKALEDTGTSSDGMVRLFIVDTGGTKKLWTEIPVPMVDQTSVSRSFVHQIDFGGGLSDENGGYNIAPGYSIIASTELSKSFAVTIEALDWNYPARGVNMLLNKNFSVVSGTATASEELLQSYQLSAGQIQAGDLLEVLANLAFTNNANKKTVRFYVNTSNSLSGATLLGFYESSSLASDLMQRAFPVINDTAIECSAGTATSLRATFQQSAGTSANVTVPSVSAGFWILISIQKANSGDSDSIRWSMVRNNRN